MPIMKIVSEVVRLRMCVLVVVSMLWAVVFVARTPRMSVNLG